MKVSSDDINHILKTADALFPKQNHRANEQQLAVLCFALCVTCRSYDVHLSVLLGKVQRCFEEMAEVDIAPLSEIYRGA